MDTLISYAGYSVGVANTKNLVADSIIAHNSDANAHSDTLVTNSAFSAAIEDIQSDIAVINSTIATISGGGFSCYIGSSPPADFNGLIFNTSEFE